MLKIMVHIPVLPNSEMKFECRSQTKKDILIIKVSVILDSSKKKEKGRGRQGRREGERKEGWKDRRKQGRKDRGKRKILASLFFRTESKNSITFLAWYNIVVLLSRHSLNSTCQKEKSNISISHWNGSPDFVFGVIFGQNITFHCQEQRYFQDVSKTSQDNHYKFAPFHKPLKKQKQKSKN